MSGLFNTLRLGANALMAQQSALNLASHNISNANTAGFSQQTAEFHARGGGTLGVDVGSIGRSTDAFVETRLLDQASRNGYADGRSQQLGRLEEVLGDMGETSFGASLDSFFTGFRKLATDAGDHSARVEALRGAEDIANHIRSMDSQLRDLAAKADLQLSVAVENGNNLISEISDLNVDIKAARASGHNVNDLIDQRDQAARELGELFGARTSVDKSGDMMVLMGGGIVVVQSGGDPRHLRLTENAVTGSLDAEMATGVGDVINTELGGSAAALIDTRDGELATRRAELDTFAFDLMTAVNAVHNAGFGLDGVGGRDLFESQATSADMARDFSVAAAVAGQPDNLAASQTATSVPGDGRNAQAIADVQSAAVADGGTRTLAEGWIRIATDAGSDAAAANDEASWRSDQLDRLIDMRESVSGVSIEEQMVLMNQYQRAYQAASRVISTADEMLQTLLAI